MKQLKCRDDTNIFSRSSFVLVFILAFGLVLLCIGPINSIRNLFDSKISVLVPHPHFRSHSAGLLHHDENHHHPRFVNLMELMDPLESRDIDAIANQEAILDEVNYLRSLAVEECRELVCSNRGKKRFGECAESLLSTDLTCKQGCQDHLQLWVLHRCYLIETFDCDGNIGPKSVNNRTMIFNNDGPQTIAEFTTSVRDVFEPKGVKCECCDFSDVVMTRETTTDLN